MARRYRDLYPMIYSFENLLIAFHKARRGKRRKRDVAEFEFNLEGNLWKLHRELREGDYEPGAYNNFYVYEQKKRLISGAPFRDRVVHHALLNVIEPLFERTFIFDSYACRVGKGQHRAVDMYTEFARKNSYVLRCDVQRFYPSVDHEILENILAKRIKDCQVMDLIRKLLSRGKEILKNEYIISWFPGDDLFTPLERPRGLPIGNLTSQFFANVYLNEFDHFMKEQLSCRYYLRYMDDFAVFSNSKSELRQIKKEVEKFLCSLRLSLDPKKTLLFPVGVGLDFLGYRVFLTHRLVRKSTVYRFSKRMKCTVKKYKKGQVSLEKMKASLVSWFGHVKHANSYNLRKMVLRRVGL